MWCVIRCPRPLSEQVPGRCEWRMPAEDARKRCARRMRVEDGREGCERKIRVQTQGEGVTPTEVVSQEASFLVCRWGCGGECLKMLLKLVSLQGFLFIMVTWRPELGEVGGRSGLSASWAGQAWALPRDRAGGGVPGRRGLPAHLSVAPAPHSAVGRGEVCGRHGWGQALLSPF